MKPSPESLSLPPRLAEKFRVESFLGKGTAGVVLLATQVSNGKQVAIKSLISDQGSWKARFAEEARLGAQIQSPHVARCLGSYLAGESLFLINQYIPGEDLSDWLAQRGGRAAWQDCEGWMKDLFRGLADIHAEGVIHRDIKPANLRIRPDQGLVILDLGVARTLEGAGITKAGQAVGSPVFMAPEQMAGRTVHPSWDLFAAGVLWYRALSGKYPADQADPTRLYRAKVAEDYEDIEWLVPEVPEHQARLIQDLLAPEPERRPSSAEEALARLEDPDRLPEARPWETIAAPSGTLSPEPGSSLASTAPSSRSRLRSLALLGGALALGFLSWRWLLAP